MTAPSHSEPCICWYGPPVLHEGGCCFRDDPTPLEDYRPGVPPPCGHWVDQPLAEQLDATQSGEEFGQVLSGFMDALAAAQEADK